MKTEKGFTLVEIALVLAIAGMIFAATFVAVPNLLASQRDARRREDMARFVTQLKNFQTNNNRGALPGTTGSDKTRLDVGRTVTVEGGELSNSVDATSWAGFYRDFLGTEFRDPDGDPYRLSVENCTIDGNLNDICNAAINKYDVLEMDKTIYVEIGATCDGDKAIKTANARKVAVIYKLEHSGQYCYNS
ncbi:prepilin-type N-terminal cleavage/methylation domain-containing protein [Candidatus Saccharibacteria bacterium]|nr:prepilin-type N-terminal cleavage/methylation domain-containing protein [Candidatus Saccharibacteria bacterium]